METKSAPINMRVFPSVRDIIDAAAKVQNLERSTFIQQAALGEAQSGLANQRDFFLDEQAFKAFDTALDASPKVDEGMKDLLSRKAPWE